jgi:hypothetical protein
MYYMHVKWWSFQVGGKGRLGEKGRGSVCGVCIALGQVFLRVLRVSPVSII